MTGITGGAGMSLVPSPPAGAAASAAGPGGAPPPPPMLPNQQQPQVHSYAANAAMNSAQSNAVNCFTQYYQPQMPTLVSTLDTTFTHVSNMTLSYSHSRTVITLIQLLLPYSYYCHTVTTTYSTTYSVNQSLI